MVIDFALNYRQQDDNNNYNMLTTRRSLQDDKSYGLMRLLLQPVRRLKTCLSFSYSDMYIEHAKVIYGARRKYIVHGHRPAYQFDQANGYRQNIFNCFVVTTMQW